MSPANPSCWRASNSICAIALTLALALPGTINSALGEESHVSRSCPVFGEGLAMGLLSDRSLNEASGMAASRNYPGILWSHNDSGDFARLYALTLDGSSLGTWTLPVGLPVDCEALAIGPAPDAPGDHLYLADIGNNGLGRDHLIIHRIPEPDIAIEGLPGQPSMQLVSYEVFFPPGIAEDVEAFAVDPLDGAFLFFTKRYAPLSYFLMAPTPNPGEKVNLVVIGTLPISMVSGADISVDGGMLVVRTYEEVIIFDRHDGESWPEALGRPGCPQPLGWENQGEAIAFLPDGSGYVTVSEGSASPVIFYPRF